MQYRQERLLRGRGSVQGAAFADTKRRRRRKTEESNPARHRRVLRRRREGAGDGNRRRRRRRRRRSRVAARHGGLRRVQGRVRGGRPGSDFGVRVVLPGLRVRPEQRHEAGPLGVPREALGRGFPRVPRVFGQTKADCRRRRPERRTPGRGHLQQRRAPHQEIRGLDP